MDSLGADIGNKIKGKWKVLLTDACHSGAITPEADSSSDRASAAPRCSTCRQSLFSLTASRDRERAP
jgi:dissimilatory sulfite reductase (desulfoviridin) alpha/beta subunit